MRGTAPSFLRLNPDAAYGVGGQDVVGVLRPAPVLFRRTGR